MAQKSERAERVMRWPDEQRSEPRRMIFAPAAVVHPDGLGESVALVRDCSDSGLFFFSQFEPTNGSDVNLRFRLTTSEGEQLHVCWGKVVRVEGTPDGVATGVALRLYKREALPVVN